MVTTVLGLHAYEGKPTTPKAIVGLFPPFPPRLHQILWQGEGETPVYSPGQSIHTKGFGFRFYYRNALVFLEITSYFPSGMGM